MSVVGSESDIDEPDAARPSHVRSGCRFATQGPTRVSSLAGGLWDGRRTGQTMWLCEDRSKRGPVCRFSQPWSGHPPGRTEKSAVGTQRDRATVCYARITVRHLPKRKPGVRSQSDRLREVGKRVVSSDHHPESTAGSKTAPAPTGNTHMESGLHKLPHPIAFASAATVRHGTGPCAARLANIRLLRCLRQERQSVSR
jgi:hypothetical protein